MPLPRRLAAFNRVATNRLTGLFAARVPPLIMLEHVGRRSHRSYKTPLMAFFPKGGRSAIVALTYGPGTEWQKNLEAAGGGELVAGGRRIQFGAPQLRHGIATAPGIPWPIRRFLRLVRVDDYLRLPILAADPERRTKQ